MYDEAFNIAKNYIYDWYQRDLASIVYKFFDEHCSGGAFTNKKKVYQRISKRLTETNYQNYLKE